MLIEDDQASGKEKWKVKDSSQEGSHRKRRATSGVFQEMKPGKQANEEQVALGHLQTQSPSFMRASLHFSLVYFSHLLVNLKYNIWSFIYLFGRQLQRQSYREVREEGKEREALGYVGGVLKASCSRHWRPIPERSNPTEGKGTRVNPNDHVGFSVANDVSLLLHWLQERHHAGTEHWRSGNLCGAGRGMQELCIFHSVFLLHQSCSIKGYEFFF